MKTRKSFFSFIFLFIALASFSQTKTASFKVAGECGMCKKKIEKAAKTAGASYAVWNADNKLLALKYNSSSTNKTKIEGAIAAAGYDTPDAKATEDAYQKLDECCQYERTVDTVQSCCESEVCVAAACTKDGKCSANAACCKEAGCDKKDCCKKE